MKAEFSREQITEATQAFLANGGKITKLNTGMSLENQLHDMEIKNSEEDRQNLKNYSAEVQEQISEFTVFKN